MALAFILTVLTQRLETVDKKSNTTSKSVTVKSIPAATIEFMMSCLEKHYTMKTEMDSIIVRVLRDVILRKIDKLTTMETHIPPTNI